LISANRDANRLTVLINNGSGGFVATYSPFVGDFPYAVVAADVNGDGRVDLISANRDSSSLTVLTNSVRDGFVWAFPIAVGPAPYALTAADVNGDGRVDLISANSGDGTLSVLLNAALNFVGNFDGRFTGNGAGLTGISRLDSPDGSPAPALAVNNDGNVGIGMTAPLGGPALLVNGRVAITGANVLELGYGVAGKESSAGKIGYQTFTAGALDIVGAGTTGLNNRRIKFWCEAGATFTGVITAPSDRHLKQDFQPLDGRTVLEKVVAMPVQSWAYKSENGKRHIGPVAQDFHAAFGLNGVDDTTIATVDADGVALAAIQGLNQKVEEQRTELKQQQTEIAELKQRLDALERIIRNQKPN
jgi:hypothetical protein